jgi:hypothetical protein
LAPWSRAYNLTKEKMKKLIMILFAAVAFSCGDGNRSSEGNDMNNTENTEAAEPDTTDMDSDNGTEDSRIEGDNRSGSDTTSTWDRDRESRSSSDSLNNKK